MDEARGTGLPHARLPMGKDAIRHALKNELQPNKNAYWRIPPKENAEWIASSCCISLKEAEKMEPCKIGLA